MLVRPLLCLPNTRGQALVAIVARMLSVATRISEERLLKQRTVLSMAQEGNQLGYEVELELARHNSQEAFRALTRTFTEEQLRLFLVYLESYNALINAALKGAHKIEIKKLYTRDDTV